MGLFPDKLETGLVGPRRSRENGVDMPNSGDPRRIERRCLRKLQEGALPSLPCEKFGGLSVCTSSPSTGADLLRARAQGASGANAERGRAGAPAMLRQDPGQVNE